jgi:chitinase
MRVLTAFARNFGFWWILSASTALSQAEPAWAPNQHYSVGDLVTYNGATYRALQAADSQPTWTPVAAPALWEPVSTESVAGVQIPPWEPFHRYVVGDVVSFGGRTYTALQAESSLPTWAPPATPALWQPVNPKGSLSCAGVADAPTGLSASNLTASTLVLAWQAATAPANCVIASYTVVVNGSQVGTTTGTSLSVTGLSAATSYTVTVLANDAVGASAPSAAIKVTTLAEPGGEGSSCAPPWVASAVYTAGMTAFANGVNYIANWWTQGNDPSSSSGGAGSGQPWTQVGVCAACTVAPSPPTGLSAAGITDSSTSLSWEAPSVPPNCTISAYVVLQNDTPIARTSGTSTSVTHLSPSTSYQFSIAAIDPAGASEPSMPVSVRTVAAGPGSGAAAFAPYVDMGLLSAQDLLTIQQQSGIEMFTLAFVVSAGGCSAGWGGVGPIANDTLSNGSSILSLVLGVRAAGGDVIISFGGADGQELALTCPDPGSLQAAYQSVIDRYQAKSIDFDIEGLAVADQASIARRNTALVALKAANPGLTISYTLPVLPTGLDANGVGILNSLKRDGLKVDVINVMAMDYGAAVDSGGRMGQDAVSAANNTAAQLSSAGLGSKVGITPMIGVNDVSTEVFQLSDAEMLLSFAQSSPDIARLSMWSVGRDNGSCAGAGFASATCSGVAQSSFQFSSIFSAF